MRRAIAPLAFALGLTLLLSWPQSLHLGTKVASHFDPYFSMWRLTWIAHALPSAPGTLFHGNIFHPAPNTLAFSDAILLQGMLGAPFLWAGASPVVVYNVLLLAGIAGSGIGMFVLARYLTRATAPALAAMAVFVMAPYRIEHFFHLELQWALWIPLTYWAVHRAIDEQSWRFGKLAGVFLWLQMLSCVYYGIFLSMSLAVLVPLLLLRAPGARPRAMAALAAGALVAVVLTLPYAIPYVQNSRTLGLRPLSEVATYSAFPVSYLAATHQNWLWSWTADWGAPELRLFPGLMALLLAAAAAWRRPVRLTATYAALALLAFELSLGVNGTLYPWLLDHLPGLHGLRAPARLGIVVLCAVAVLAALGLQTLVEWTRRGNGRMAHAAAGVAILLLVVDYLPTGMVLTDVAPDPPAGRSVYAALRRLPAGPVVDLPVPPANRLPGYDPWYIYWSRHHWRPLVNGYSGFYPAEYPRTITDLQAFPRARAIRVLTRLGARYVIVHRTHYPPGEYLSLVLDMDAHPGLHHIGTFRAPSGEVELFRVGPE